ncbi:biliverdin-producing heme oxygenase [Roseomonas terrae]|uniref:Biliverdin-producing heme oxygenase n=1 Tax=Neoroseomonas terrae TaxID=424799 RepID=A0ABS5EP58_9PROT|nr:biliverdin-producing heme oxygenase [Neoroseomonas terrae]MBR0652814.1 biliverdin-producing heme oxygenase [Neoroseomonas terrae]
MEQRFSRFDLGCRDGYRAFLSLQAAAVIPLEAGLERAGIERELPDWPQRSRAAALLADLAAMGHTPAPVAPVTVADGPEALGAAYVLEGSRLGAAVLLRQAGTGLPDRFLRHGARSGLWPSFLARLRRTPEAHGPAAIRGARLAFAQFLDERVPA